MRSPRPETLLAHAGRPAGARVPVNPPVVRASTVLFDSMQTLQQALQERARHERGLLYGRKGTPTTDALEDVLIGLEGGHGCRLFGSGLAAITATLLACVRTGDHMLVIDSCYEPVRRICHQYLEPMGVQVEFFRPDLEDLAGKMRPATKLVWAETPGSLVYEMCDLPRLVALVRRQPGVVVAVDNTWGSGLLYNPLALGADISVIAGTKYLCGHSDAMVGAVITTQAAWPRITALADLMGLSIGPDDAALALRGTRTLAVRMRQHGASALVVARWLLQQPCVRTVFHPALPEDPGHALWCRDFRGANGLLSLEFVAGTTQEQVHGFVEALQWFGLGHSWGGYESLVLPVDPAAVHRPGAWVDRGAVVRLHVGLEDPEDLVADLAQALDVAGLARHPG